MAIIDIRENQDAFWGSPEDPFTEEEMFLIDRERDDRLDILAAMGVEVSVVPFGEGIDLEEARVSGIHAPSGVIIRPSGDGYHNPYGNGAHLDSTMIGNLVKSGHDIASL